MDKYKLILLSGLAVEHFGYTWQDAKEYVEKRFKTKVARILDLQIENQLVYLKGGWFRVDED